MGDINNIHDLIQKYSKRIVDLKYVLLTQKPGLTERIKISHRVKDCEEFIKDLKYLV